MEQIVRLFNIASCRAFLPVNMLVLVFFYKIFGSDYQVSEISFALAFAQVLSQFDGGVSAYIISTPRSERSGHSFGAVKYYLRRIAGAVLSMGAILAAALWGAGYDIWGLVVVVFLLSISIVIFNCAMSVCLKDKLWSELWKIVFFSLVAEVFFLFIFLKFSDNSVVNVFFVLGMLFFVYLIPLFFIKLSSDFFVDKTHAEKLQVSQVFASLVLNKEYILLHLFGFTVAASQMALAGRCMYAVIQVVSVFVSKHWIDIADAHDLSRDRYAGAAIKITAFSFFAATPVALLLYFSEHVSALLGFALLLYVLGNSYSALASAYASVDHQAIPRASWFMCCVATLIVGSVASYFFGVWVFSILLTVLYFLVLGKYSLGRVRWI